MLMHHQHLQVNRQEGDTSQIKDKLEKRDVGEGSRGLIDQVTESKSSLAAIG